MFPLAEGELGFWNIAVVFAYLIGTVGLGWLGYMRTKTAADYRDRPVVDSIDIALPVSIIIAAIVSMFTQPEPKEHLEKCFA